MKRSRIVAIHQPNFFPWLGYFDKIARSDVFILLDHVQLPKKGGTWSNRVKLLVGREARWVTAPIVRNFHGVRAINEVEFRSSNRWRDKFVSSLTANYTRAAYYDETMGFIVPIISNPENNVARYNGVAVKALANYLGISDERFLWSSEIGVNTQASEMLIALTQSVDGDSYLSGGGAHGYQDDAAFAAAGVKLIYQRFVHPVYPQIGFTEFVPGLSVIDTLMNLGRDGTRVALRIV